MTSDPHASALPPLPSPSIGQRLREETRAQHEAAEKGPFQQSLTRGALPREGYADLLGQLLLVHRALEGQLRRHRAGVPAIAAIVEDYQYQEPYLLEDLAFFGRPGREGAAGGESGRGGMAPPPIAATAKFIAEVERLGRTDPVALLGAQYVLEGSNNGGRYIAKAVQRAYGLEPGPGTRYLDPYGELQRGRWLQFKAALDGATLTRAEQDAIVEAAKATFTAIAEIHEGLEHPSPLLPIVPASTGGLRRA